MNLGRKLAGAFYLLVFGGHPARTAGAAGLFHQYRINECAAAHTTGLEPMKSALDGCPRTLWHPYSLASGPGCCAASTLMAGGFIEIGRITGLYVGSLAMAVTIFSCRSVVFAHYSACVMPLNVSLRVVLVTFLLLGLLRLDQCARVLCHDCWRTAVRQICFAKPRASSLPGQRVWFGCIRAQFEALCTRVLDFDFRCSS